ncbi:MAG TPA: hypothetical protein VMZ49_00590 [Patescibacteria group bacterium]|nr:hypothetical protein [Patescibacteria group bacterium]
MPVKILPLALILTFCCLAPGWGQKQAPNRLTGPYLGQKPPGMTPELFAPGIISLAGFVDFKGSFSPDGNEYYFYRLSHPPDELVLTFPCIAPDGSYLFFSKNGDIWWVDTKVIEKLRPLE